MSVVLLALLVVVVSAWGLKKRMPKASPAIMGIAAVAAILVGLYSVIYGRPRTEADLLNDAETIAGAQMAGKVVTDFPKGGTLLVLEMPPLNGASKDVSQRRMEGVRKELAKAPFRLVAAGPEVMGRSSSDKSFKMLKPGDVAGQVHAWCRLNTGVVAVVSLLMELPDLQSVESEGMPPWYGFDAGPSENYRKAVDKKLLKSAILYRGDFGAIAAPGTSEKQMFESVFRVFDPAQEKAAP
jgi:hypothetical protein